MSIAIWCLLIAATLPFITVGIAKWDRSYNNNEPRLWLEQRTGMQKRADYAHRNHFEAFPVFATGVLLAMLFKVPAGEVNALALAFVGARVLYTVFYLTNQGSLRSLVWMVGQGCSATLIVHAALLAI